MRFCALGLLIFCSALIASCTAADRPNVIIIFTDDQGYNDLSCFGSPNIRTPNIDRMAAEGMRLTSFYSGASVCTPSRMALLTGCYPERVGNLGVLFPNSDVGINADETTTAEMLRQRGYATACFGKWHLGHHQAFLPTEHGFDEYFGIPYSNDMGVDPSMRLADNIVLREGRTIEDFRDNVGKSPPLMRNKEVIEWPADQSLLTRRYTDEATRFITAHAQEPFFVYLPHTMPHIPLYVSEAFLGKSDAGLYGDAIEEIDWSVGEILKTLKDLKIDDNTLIVYTSDNGPWDFKDDDKHRVKGDRNRKAGGSADPLRGAKFSNWEGGFRVPCVMRWPGRIPAGQVCNEITASIDLLPTIAEFSGALIPTQHTIDGKSIVPLLEGPSEAKTPHETYFYRTAAVRSGKWKFVAQHHQLFDLEADISESTDVADQFPDVTARLRKLLEDHKSDMKLNGRSPGHFDRPPHPLEALPGWTIQKGHWNLIKRQMLRQNSNKFVSEVVSPKLSGEVSVVEVDARLIDPTGGFGVALVRQSSEERISFTLGEDGNTPHIIKLAAESAKSAFAGMINGTEWHHIRVDINEKKITASVDGKQMGTLDLDSDLRADQIALIGIKSKSEYRNLRVIGRGETILLEALTPPVK
ncbi:MAG: sulfatase [Planctomycetaceae bacterium]|nr:sulfatase [Planctomycetaceae bacterium]